MKVIMSKELMQPHYLVGLNIRVSYGCHVQYMVNMQGFISFLVMVVIISKNDD